MGDYSSIQNTWELALKGAGHEGFTLGRLLTTLSLKSKCARRALPTRGFFMENAQEENIRVYREYYSTFARDYEKRTKEGARKIAETMINWIDLTDLQVLDLGVGTGLVWEELYKKGISNVHVVGLDVAPGTLKIAKEKHIP